MTKKFILSMGHRNTNRGGAYREFEWTPIATRKLAAAIRRRGGIADLVQELDNDNDPNDSIGRNLSSVALRCVELSKTRGPYEAYISMHYGAEPVDGFFVIPPGCEGLNHCDPIDVSTNNPTDYKLATTMAKHVAKTGMRIRGNGILPENRSGVALSGNWRLGELAGTIGFRQRTARVIVEGGNYLSAIDRALLWSPTWQDAYAEALCDALEEVFGKMGDDTVITPDPPSAPAEPALTRITGASEGRYIVLENGAHVIALPVNTRVRAVKDTHQYQFASRSSKTVGGTIKAGTEFTISDLIINADKSLWYYTPFFSRIPFEDVAPVV